MSCVEHFLEASNNTIFLKETDVVLNFLSYSYTIVYFSRELQKRVKKKLAWKNENKLSMIDSESVLNIFAGLETSLDSKIQIFQGTALSSLVKVLKKHESTAELN